ncbi:S9 family peptidase [Dysgonomonas massiliensis]|uniref:S9 family peptidase n=1 Tax=Dysgonomonas massiliensis TaxID=2040292 RepID=UPI000C75D9C8|nr:S9 family peptidase [Dysgonomonas massiliensis]
MKFKTVMTLALGATMLACGTKEKPAEDAAPLIGKSSIKIENGIMTPEALYSFGRLSDVQISPDKSRILYGVTYVSVEQNKTNRELFTMNVDGSDKVQITQTPKSENNAIWFNEGKKIAFLSSENGSSQIWEMNPDGTNRKQISNVDGGINGFMFSPDETKILYIKNIKYGERTADRYPQLTKATGLIIDDLMYKHWDTWIEEIPHPFIANFDENTLTNDFDILEGEPFESPMLPFGGTEQFSWTPDGKSIAYTSRKKTGRAYAESTNSDIYLYNLETKETRNLTEGMMGYDINPTFSADGKYMAWQSMERDGYESDKNRLFVMNMETGEKTYLTENFDYNTDAITWNTDNKSLYIVSCVEARTHIHKVDIATKEIKTITKGDFDYESVALAGENKLIAVRHSLSKPNEIYAVDETSGEATELSFENEHILSQLTMANVEARWIPTTDGKKMLTWVVYPPNFDPAKKYPALLYCQGGPQSTVSQFWSYRWNPQIMAANGYIIVMPNRHGVPGFGQEWNEQISGDYGGQNMKDYLAAIDELAKEPFVDENRLGCTGASYGGFSTFWLAGNHNKRFKAFFAHAGIFNLEAQYLETEEMWFANWDLGGSYWDRNNKIAQRSYANSPHLFVDKWDTPIMISHGEKDFRILASQGMMAFNAAKLRDIPARLLIYPDENHWITQPQNGVLFQNEFFRWFDQWLK